MAVPPAQPADEKGPFFVREHLVVRHCPFASLSPSVHIRQRGLADFPLPIAGVDLQKHYSHMQKLPRGTEALLTAPGRHSLICVPPQNVFEQSC